MKKENLTGMLNSYKKGFLVKNELVEAVSLYVYKFPSRNYNWNEDECSDFYIYFYPKILRMIDKFELNSIPFEVYLKKTLKMQIKTFAARRTEETAESRILRHKEFWPGEYSVQNMHCCENIGDYETPSAGMLISEKLCALKNSGIIKSRSHKKRILMLGLKHINTLEEKDVSEIIELSGCDSLWFKSSKQKLTESILMRVERRQKLIERKNRFFCRLYYLHEKYAAETADTEKDRISGEICKVKNRIETLAERIKKISSHPTHRDIADVMKIPKGSVDSGLYYLRLYLEKKY